MAISSAKKQMRLRQRLVGLARPRHFSLPPIFLGLPCHRWFAATAAAIAGLAPRPVEAVAPRFELSQRSIEGLAQNEEPGLESRQRTAMSRREAAMTAFAKSWWRE